MRSAEKRAAMPFINGKHYMNPAYGRAMERARARGKLGVTPLVYYYDNAERETGPSELDSGHDALENRGIIENFAGSQKPTHAGRGSEKSDGRWVTINGRHVLIHEGNEQMEQPKDQLERLLAIVVFNETGGLSSSSKTGRGSAEDLHNARVAIAEIAKTLREAGHPEQVAPAEGGIYSGLWEGLAEGNSAPYTPGTIRYRRPGQPCKVPIRRGMLRITDWTGRMVGCQIGQGVPLP